MEQKPLISVIVPIYKVEKYLSYCIESILKQSFTDFELLLIDDGSPDDCGVAGEQLQLHGVQPRGGDNGVEQCGGGLSAPCRHDAATGKNREIVCQARARDV